MILLLATLIPYSLSLDLATRRSVPGTPFQRCKMKFDKHQNFNLAFNLSTTPGQRTKVELWQKMWELQGCPGSVVGNILRDTALPQGHILVSKWDCPTTKVTAGWTPKRYTLWVLSPEGKATKHSEFIKRNAGATPTGQVAAPAAAAPVSLPDAPRDPAAAAGPSNPTGGAPPAPAINAAPASDDQPDNDELTKRVANVMMEALLHQLLKAPCKRQRRE